MDWTAMNCQTLTSSLMEVTSRTETLESFTMTTNRVSPLGWPKILAHTIINKDEISLYSVYLKTLLIHKILINKNRWSGIGEYYLTIHQESKLCLLHKYGWSCNQSFKNIVQTGTGTEPFLTIITIRVHIPQIERYKRN